MTCFVVKFGAADYSSSSIRLYLYMRQHRIVPTSGECDFSTSHITLCKEWGKVSRLGRYLLSRYYRVQSSKGPFFNCVGRPVRGRHSKTYNLQLVVGFASYMACLLLLLHARGVKQFLFDTCTLHTTTAHIAHPTLLNRAPNLLFLVCHVA